jgi:hypothetical protein
MNMRTRKTFLVACVAAVVVLCFSMTGHASRSRTYLTFNQRVALPGVTLEKGTYVFERVGIGEDLVRVTSRDGQRVYLTVFTNEVQRPAGLPTHDPVMFAESASGTPPPITAWFPEATSTGRAFIYR